MCLDMIEKPDLSLVRSKLVQERLSLPQHRNDLGPPQVWATYTSRLYALFEEPSGRLVALVEASGLNDVQPGWWIDSAFRGKDYGNKVIDILAQHLKAQGVTRIGPILITTYQQQYDEQSSKLAQRLRSYFE